MNVEQTLTDELRTVADTVTAPPPPAVAALVQQAASARTRSRVRWAATTLLAAAAVVAAIVAGTQLDDPDATPPPTHPTKTASADPLPVGRPLRTYVDPTTDALYLDGVAVRGNGWIGARTIGDLTLGFLGAPDSGYVGVFVGTERAGTVHPADSDQVEVAPGRRTIAWVERKGATGVIVVARVSTDGMHELGRLSLATLARGVDDESRERLLAVADDGTVTYGGVVGGHRWKPGTSPQVADISSSMYGPAGFPGRAEDVQLNPSGSWGAWLTDPRDPGDGGGEASWSSVTFQQPGKPATRTRIAMPDPENDVRSLYWESETDIVLATYTGNPFDHEPLDYVRCHVIERSCELAPGWGDH